MEITSHVPRTKRVEKETRKFRGLMAGDTDEERRELFKYYRTIYGDKDDRKAMRAIEDEGRVRLVDYKIIQELGIRHGN